MNSFYKEFGPKQMAQPLPNQPTIDNNYLQNAMNQAQQIMNNLRGTPQFRNIPAQIQNDPDQILQYLQQNPNMLNPIQRQVLNMMMYRR